MPLASDEAYRCLKDWIQTGTIPAGGLIDEAETVKQLGMSRTPVREALLKLQSEGYLEISRKGIRVLPLSNADLREMYQVISALETMAVSLIVERKPAAAEFAPIKAIVADMKARNAASDIEKWGEADEAFHRELMRLSGNSKLFTFGCQMRDLAKRAHGVALRMQSDQYRAQSTTNHAKLVTSIQRGEDGGSAESHRAQRKRGEDALVGLVEKFQLSGL